MAGDPHEQAVEARVIRAAEAFLCAWDEFDGPPLSPQDIYDAVSEAVEELRSAMRRGDADG